MKKLLLTIFLILCLNVFANHSFNVELEIPRAYNEIAAGEELWFTAKISNLANDEKLDVILTYEIFHEEKEIFTKSETVAVETTASFSNKIIVPENLKKGLYHLKVKLTPIDSDLDMSKAETSFNIIKEQDEGLRRLYSIVTHLALFILLGIIIRFFYNKYSPACGKFCVRQKVKKIVEKRQNEIRKK